MTGAEERQPWELGGDADGSAAPVNPTNAPIDEEERGAHAAHAGPDDLPADEEDEGEDDGEEDPEEAGPLDEEEPPPQRSHEDEGAVGAGSQYAAEDAADEEHAQPRGPAGAA